ncbi:hypothetical protein OC25_07710 [Pedobacter kyungheensis]|uniref:Uncharacterized protein n=1 Tax=Pedobacter kyungheensis TaxID=1069985 RepID=A0A0C1G4X9_9SPHI|nr:hypothetical protein OC25_07710 [Pedobacter kyungheensis]
MPLIVAMIIIIYLYAKRRKTSCFTAIIFYCMAGIAIHNLYLLKNKPFFISTLAIQNTVQILYPALASFQLT